MGDPARGIVGPSGVLNGTIPRGRKRAWRWIIIYGNFFPSGNTRTFRGGSGWAQMGYKGRDVLLLVVSYLSLF